MDPQSEFELLARCLGRRRPETIAHALMALSDPRWEALVEGAARQGVAPLLYHRLRGLASRATWGGHALGRLREIHLHSALRNTALFEELGHLLAELQEVGIPVVALKGAHLAASVYPEPAMRPMRDVDLLVRPADLPRVELELLKWGFARTKSTGDDTDYSNYSKHHHLRPFVRHGMIPVEIHHTIAPGGNPFRVDIEAMWARTRPTRSGEVSILVLSPEDLVLHLSTHASYNHRFKIPLLALCDIDATVWRHRDQLDWTRLVTTANEDGRGRFVYCALRLVEEVLKTPMPQNRLAALAHQDVDERTVHAVRGSIPNAWPELPVAYQQLGDCRGLPDRIRLLVLSVFPPRERLRRIYGLPRRSSLVYWYYLFRPLDLLIRHGRVTVAILFRTRRPSPALERLRKRWAINQWVRQTRDEVRASQGWKQSWTTKDSVTSATVH